MLVIITDENPGVGVEMFAWFIDSYICLSMHVVRFTWAMVKFPEYQAGITSDIPET